MIHINRQPDIPPAFRSDSIKNDIKKYKDFYKREAKTRTQEGFSEVINGDTQETLEAVAHQFKFKCAACEIKLNIRKVISDSWRPRQNAKGLEDEYARDHYWWLAYEWQNKYALCSVCNNFKATWFPVEGKRAAPKARYLTVIKTENALLIDPCNDYPEEHLCVNLKDGSFLPLSKKGEITIEILKLNRKDLLDARKKVIDLTREMMSTIEHLYVRKTVKGISNRDNLIQLCGYLSDIRETLSEHPEQEFVFVKRHMLLNWLDQNTSYRSADLFESKFGGSISNADLAQAKDDIRHIDKVFKRKDLSYKISSTVRPKLGYLEQSGMVKPAKNVTKKPAKKKSSKVIPKVTPGKTTGVTVQQAIKTVSSILDYATLGINILKPGLDILSDAFDSKKLRRLYPEKIEISNFKSISKLSFDFKIPQPAGNKSIGLTQTNSKEPWKFLLGENGVGKSTILQAISLVVAGKEYIETLSLKPGDLLKHGTRAGYVKIWFVGESIPGELHITSKKMTCNFPTGKINVLGYGSTRVMPKAGTSLQPEESNAAVKVKNLFDYSVSLTDVKKWLLKIDKKSFDHVAKALKDVLDLPSLETYFIRENDEVYFSVEKETLEQLSEGYRSVIALAVDIMKSLSDAGVKKSGSQLSYEVMEGMVLIDEISSHLHPRWQMKIVKVLRKAFPKLLFIVTSHDPLSLKGVENGEVLLLKRDENKNVISINNLPDPTELRAEQILTSEFFGLNSTLDPELEIQFNTYHFLLAKNSLTAAEQKQLGELKISLKEKKHLGNSLREEMMYSVIDESLAKYSNNIEEVSREELFDDAKSKVISLWDTLYKNKS